MRIDALLDRLDCVKQYGKGWRARCPCCNGRSRDHLALTEADDGRVLLHAFCGCTALDVLQAVGLTLADLYPERVQPTTEAGRRSAWAEAKAAAWRAALSTLDEATTVVELAAERMACGVPMSEADRATLHQAAERVADARATLCTRR